MRNLSIERAADRKLNLIVGHPRTTRIVADSAVPPARQFGAPLPFG
jgi:predicted Zn-dependent protease